VIGNDSVINYSEAFGSLLDLNVCKPIMIYNLLESFEILSNATENFIDKCLIDINPNIKQINSHLERILMTVTNLTQYIGYDKCSEIAQKAFKEGKTIKEVILEMGLEIEEDLDKLLDPKKMI
jgi:fumarate hydratase class II